MSILDAARKRYTTKAYRADETIPAETIQQLCELLRLSPSSVNSQPWHFVVAGSPEGRARMAKATDSGFACNSPKILHASHVIALCARVDLDEAYLQRLLEQEQRDGRFAGPEARQAQDTARRGYVQLHRYDHKDLPQWAGRQVYLALGTLLLGAASLGLDATPMEGFDAQILDRELGLHALGCSSVVLVCLGYRSEHDFNAGLPKSRLPERETFSFI
ncbi:oxygen-insensitive NAD(P)H nitroreductase [Frateuria aurantia]